MLPWLESSAVARTIGDSLLITGLVSAVHLLGTTLVGGGALIAGLRMLGVVLTDWPVGEIVRPAGRGIAAGLAISVATGTLLFSPRASTFAASDVFQSKMLILAGAVVFQVSVYRFAVDRGDRAPALRWLVGALCIALWIGVVGAGCALILLGE